MFYPAGSMRFAELHCHSNFSFLDGASAAEDLVERAVELGLSGLAVTDHQGLYGAVRFSAAAREAGLRADRRHGGRAARPGRPRSRAASSPPAGGCVDGAAERHRRAEASARRQGEPARPPVERLRPPGHREPRREDLRGVRATRARARTSCCIARDMTGYRSLCRLASAAHLAGTRACRASPTSCSPSTPRGSWR